MLKNLAQKDFQNMFKNLAQRSFKNMLKNLAQLFSSNKTTIPKKGVLKYV